MATILRLSVAAIILFAAGHVIAQSDEDLSGEQLHWVERIEQENQRARISASDERRLARQINQAKRRDYPRGEALAELRSELEFAREQRAEAEALLPELLESARRAGVSRGELRRLEATLPASLRD